MQGFLLRLSVFLAINSCARVSSKDTGEGRYKDYNEQQYGQNLGRTSLIPNKPEQEVLTKPLNFIELNSTDVRRVADNKKFQTVEQNPKIKQAHDLNRRGSINPDKYGIVGEHEVLTSLNKFMKKTLPGLEKLASKNNFQTKNNPREKQAHDLNRRGSINPDKYGIVGEHEVLTSLHKFMKQKLPGLKKEADSKNFERIKNNSRNKQAHHLTRRSVIRDKLGQKVADESTKPKKGHLFLCNHASADKGLANKYSYFRKAFMIPAQH